MKIEEDDKFNAVTLTLNLSVKTNELLSRTSARSGRSKRQEALLRLEDHLNEFVDIAAPGKNLARDFQLLIKGDSHPESLIS